MQNFSKDGVGQKLYINFDTDVSTATSYDMTIQPENGEIQEVTPTLGTSDIVVNEKTFLANQYVEYAITADMFATHVGRWRAKAKATFSSTNILSTRYVLFRVTG
jgi:hypothetical protein